LSPAAVGLFFFRERGRPACWTKEDRLAGQKRRAPGPPRPNALRSKRVVAAIHARYSLFNANDLIRNTETWGLRTQRVGPPRRSTRSGGSKRRSPGIGSKSRSGGGVCSRSWPQWTAVEFDRRPATLVSVFGAFPSLFEHAQLEYLRPAGGALRRRRGCIQGRERTTTLLALRRPASAVRLPCAA
jgi:hypothetical protein